MISVSLVLFPQLPMNGFDFSFVPVAISIENQNERANSTEMQISWLNINMYTTAI